MQPRFRILLSLIIGTIIIGIPLLLWGINNLIPEGDPPDNGDPPDSNPLFFDTPYPQLLILDGNTSTNLPKLAVVWYTPTPQKFTFHFGSNESALDTTIESSESREHVFILPTLNPATVYFYRINSGPLYNFTTPTNQTDSLKLAIGSDAHFGRNTPRTTENIFGAIDQLNPTVDAIFTIGDMVEYGGVGSHWEQYLKFLQPFTSRIPYRPAIGNHEILLGGRENYFNFFYPEATPLQHSPSRDYYRIDLNGVHIFVLDLEWGNSSNSPLQQQWLRAQLASIDPDDWIIVMCHAFIYASGGYILGDLWADDPEMIQEFASLFEDAGVDFVFSGHNHQGEVLQPNSTMYCITGRLGGVLEKDRVVNGTGTLWYDNTNFGFTTLDLNATAGTVQYYAPNGTEMVRFTKLR
jgi:hypothetical protein